MISGARCDTIPFESRRPRRNSAIATSRQLAVESARIADGKKASEIVILDLRRLNAITDFFVLCSAQNDRQSRAIAEEVAFQMKRKGMRAYGIEGERGAPWILEDFGDFVLHVFRESHRRFYDLESLWADAPLVGWEKKARRAGKSKARAAEATGATGTTG
ncbi:MAG TPA: ribosome silencing factor [Planctomycetota bacterium]|nr:ribosome silencing factor [Planctomycetota bacterium]